MVVIMQLKKESELDMLFQEGTLLSESVIYLS